MSEQQGGVCACCGNDPTAHFKTGRPTLVVDHDHETGVIRGLLCSPCNRAIGHLGDSVEGLQAAIDYLNRDVRGT